MNAQTRPLVYVVDDDANFTRLVETVCGHVGIEVAAYGDLADFHGRSTSNRPECLVLDMRLPGASGLQLLESVAVLPMPVILVTAFEEATVVQRAFRAGCHDFHCKTNLSPQQLLESIQEALWDANEQYRHRRVRDAFLARLETLTAAERRVLDQLLLGRRRGEIATELAVSPKTIETHRARVFRKLAVGTLGELFRAAAAADLLIPMYEPAEEG